MTSVEDIMTFLQAEKEARAVENQEARESRRKERAEDMKRIEMMIKHGVQEEVNAALHPLQERLDQQEKVVEDLVKQLSDIMTEMNTLRSETPKYPCDQFPALHEVDGGSGGEVVQADGAAGHDDTSQYQAERICAAARRVVGLTPISPRMLDIQQQSYGAQNFQEAMFLEVKSYLKCELRIPSSVIEKLNIVNVFHPAKDDWNTLYIELSSEEGVDTIYSYTRNIMRRDHRVFPYIPKEMYRRYKAAETFLFNIRHEEKLKTKVKIGKKDLILSTKVPGSSYWRKCPIPQNLPPIDIHSPTEPLSFLQRNLTL